MGILDGLFGGGGGGDPLDLYGDLFTDKQKSALRQRELSQGLLSFAAKLGAASAPSRVPQGSFLGTLGQALGGFAPNDDAAERQLKAMQTAEAVRAARRKRELGEKVVPFFWKVAGGGIVQSPQGVPPAPGAVPLGPDPAAGAPGANAAPPMGAPGAEPLPDMPPPITAIPGFEALPGGGFRAIPAGAPQQQTGLLPPPPGAPQQNTGLLPPPDQVVGPDGRPLTGPGVFPNMLASYAGGTPGGTLPFQLATGPGSPGAAGDDVLDTVVAPLESGNRNIRQQVLGPQGGYNPSVGRVTGPSTAGGFYQITDSTWRDTAPKAGVSLDAYPDAVSAPRDVQKTVAEKLRSERGLQPWADFNPAVAAATGYRRGGRFAGAGPDAGRIPAGGGDQMQAISALMRLIGGGEEDDPLASLTGGGPDTVLRPDSGGSDLPVRQATASLAPYATGNAVLGGPSSVAGVGPDMSGRIERMVQAMPPDVRERFLITSGFRDAQRQAQVNPGVTNSRHMHGAAVDLAKDPVVLDWINKNPQYGLGFPLSADPRETNHLEMIDPNGGRLPIMRAQYSPGGAAPAGGAAASGAGGGTIPGLNMTPQQLGAFNALFEMSGLGDPFKSLLETYYKSPGYLGEKATAETKARTDIEDPLNQRMKVLEMALKMRQDGILYNPQTGEIKADPEWDKIHGRRAEDTKILELDYSKRLKTFEEQQKIAEETRKDQKEIAPQPIYQGGVIVEQPMTREAAVAKLKDQSMRPGQYRDGDIVAKPIGNLSPDHQYKMSPTGGLTVEPIAGTPGAEKAAAAAKAKDISDRQLLVSRDIVVQDADRLENLIKTSPVPVTGMMGSLLSNMPGTPQSNAKALIDGLRARASIDAINRARAATGSTGLGQITMGEHALLANALANLEQSQGEAQLLFNLRRFKQEYIDAVHGPGAHSSLLPDTPVVKTPSSAPAGTATAPPADAARLRSEAADAIKAGKSRSAVIKRLQDMGVDPGGL